MRPLRRRTAAAAFALICLLAAPGCKDLNPVTMQLPTFFSAGIDELWFWRLDETTGGYVRKGHLELEGITGPAGSQVLQYAVVNGDGTTLMLLEAPVSIQTDSVTVQLSYYGTATPGWYRVSARNAAGESALSSKEIYF